MESSRDVGEAGGGSQHVPGLVDGSRDPRVVEEEPHLDGRRGTRAVEVLTGDVDRDCGTGGGDGSDEVIRGPGVELVEPRSEPLGDDGIPCGRDRLRVADTV